MDDAEIAAAKRALLELGAKKDAVEAELAAALEFLHSSAAAQVGCHGPLIDTEGFPRNDVDIVAIRKARNVVARGRNDIKAIEMELEQGLVALHSQTRRAAEQQMALDDADREAKARAAADKLRLMSEESAVRSMRPILKVLRVAPQSPGAFAGFQPGDLVMRFGSVSCEPTTSRQCDPTEVFSRVGALARQSEGTLVNVWLMRAGDAVRAPLVPQRGWGGEGVLGVEFEVC
jgi:26S proteasome non-ATPase regulatory subunit 9